jgi:hypothetical protein
MQATVPSAPHTWLDFAVYAIATFVAASGWFSAWRSRRKPDAEVRKMDAETRQIEADVTKTYNDIIRDINRDLREALKENEEKTDDLEEWKRRALSVPVLEQQIEDFQMILGLNKIDFAEAMDKLTRIKNSRAH